MGLTIRLFGRELLFIGSSDGQSETTDERRREWEEWRAEAGTSSGEFGFGRTDLTAIEHHEDRWETKRVEH